MAVAAVPEVPGFKALSPLGVGPSSDIYSAHSEDLGRWVALTVYSSTVTGDRCRSRFRRAYELTRRLGVHPHTVTVLAHGVTPDRRPYIVTEFYEHGTFDSRVTGHQPFPVDKTLRIGIALAGALETAHRADVIHGGVHPARILADSDDEPSLADTGLVLLVEPSGVEALLGPINYHAPPEVLEDDECSPATDVYSLASTLYTLLTACPPYSSSDPEDTSAALLLRILRHEVPPIPRPDIPPSLEQALRAALHSDPRRRQGTMLAFAQSLQAVQKEIGAPVTQPVLLDITPRLDLVTGAAAGQGPSLPFQDPSLPLQGPPPRQASQPPEPVLADAPVAPTAGGDTASVQAPDQQAFVPYPPPKLQPWSPAPEEAPLAQAPPRPVRPDMAPWADSTRSAAAGVDAGQPLHERLSAAGPWPGPPSSTDDGALGLVDAEADLFEDGDLPQEEAPEPTDQAALATMPPARGPRALPLIVLGAIVVMLLVGAVWMVVSGSDPSDAGVVLEASGPPRPGLQWAP